MLDQGAMRRPGELEEAGHVAGRRAARAGDPVRGAV